MSDISVVLLTYNSSLSRTLLSLKSVIYQKDVDVDIVISDDGSKDNNFNEIKSFFKKNNFSNYTLIPHKENSGTINSFLSAIDVVKTKYFKDLGQGDMLYDELTLKKIVDYCKDNEPALFFTDAVYYNLTNNNLNVFEFNRFPQNIEIYSKNNCDAIKKYQLAYDDIVLGSTFIYRTDIAKKYLMMIQGKVQYAEDNALRLMTLYKEKIEYFPINSLIYEYGSGISTSKNTEFEKKLDLDWQNTNDIILDECKKHPDKYSKQIIAHIEYDRQSEHSLYDKLRYYITNKGFLTYRLFLEKMPKKTKAVYDRDFMRKCIGND